MSHHGIGLWFTPGQGGRPQVLLLQDVETHCASCGLEHHERFYLGTSFHALTLARLRQLASNVPAQLAAVCRQCEAAIGPAEAVRWQTHYGFPGAVGLVSAYAVDGEVTVWELHPHDRMDVQLIPRRQPLDDASGVRVTTLTEDDIWRVFGHTFHGKGRLRRWLLQEGAPRTAPLALADGLFVVASDVPLTPEALVEAVPWLSTHAFVCEPLVEDHLPVDGYPSAPSEWLADLAEAELPPYLVAVCVYGVHAEAAEAWRPAPSGATDDDPACVDASNLRAEDNDPVSGPAMRAACEVVGTFSISVRVRRDEGFNFWLQPPWAWEAAHAPRFDVPTMAVEAARTLTPLTWIVHLEIDRTILYLTGLIGGDYSDEAMAAAAAGKALAVQGRVNERGGATG